ncbi:uncharacterized protein VP01_6369g1 [Puccinia sorghi]|uniref:Uncharacterized protein n=1 Tax=Puccinia sorghi TaxID=27349 RepID=A0A0L6UG33_9BASI|nr:uncharacterized protein VP01_6369g1 [Puccinia sorghi]
MAVMIIHSTESVLERLNAQTPDYKRMQLPPRYSLQNFQAVAFLVTEIRNQLKHVQNKVRNILLTGLISNVSPDYIPNITELSQLFWRHCNGIKTGKTTDQVDDKITVMLKTCVPMRSDRFLTGALETATGKLYQKLIFQHIWNRLVSSRDKSLFSNLPPQDKLVNGNVQAQLTRKSLKKWQGM